MLCLRIRSLDITPLGGFSHPKILELPVLERTRTREGLPRVFRLAKTVAYSTALANGEEAERGDRDAGRQAHVHVHAHVMYMWLPRRRRVRAPARAAQHDPPHVESTRPSPTLMAIPPLLNALPSPRLPMANVPALPRGFDEIVKRSMLSRYSVGTLKTQP